MDKLEKHFLATILYNDKNIYRVLDLIKPEFIIDEEARLIYTAMLQCVQEKINIDEINLYLKLKDKIPAQDISQLALIPPSQNILTLARKIYEKYTLRELKKWGKQIQNIGENEDPIDTIKFIENKIFELTQGFYSKNYEDIKTSMAKTIDMIEQIKKGGNGLLAIKTGFVDLDNLVCGFKRGDLIIIAGRPSMGKTSLALNIADNIAQQNYKVAFNSLEMSAFQMNLRLLSQRTGIDFNKIISGKFTTEEARRILIAQDSVKNIFIDDTAGLDIFDLEGKSKRLEIEQDIDILFVDYLQLLKDKTKEVREQEISSITNRLKGIAKNLNIIVVALAQMNRSVEARTNKKPQLSDLRESGAIEQDADLVLFVHRPEYYGIPYLEDNTPTENLAQIIVGKNRNGAVGEIKLVFDKEHTLFKNYYQLEL